MNTEKLIELVDGSDMNQLQKNVTKGFITRAKEAEDKRNRTRDLIEEVYGKDRIDEVLLTTDELIVFSISGRKNDPFDNKFPIRGVSFNQKKNRWERINTACSTLDEMFLTFLEKKYLGDNEQFTHYAMKMLEMPITEI